MEYFLSLESLCLGVELVSERDAARAVVRFAESPLFRCSYCSVPDVASARYLWEVEVSVQLNEVRWSLRNKAARLLSAVNRKTHNLCITRSDSRCEKETCDECCWGGSDRSGLVYWWL
jgi:hypothetical protein